MLATANTGKNRERFVENTGEWTGMVEIRKEEIPGSKDLLQTLEGERLSSVFSPDGTLNSLSAASHCGDRWREIKCVCIDGGWGVRYLLS